MNKKKIIITTLAVLAVAGSGMAIADWGDRKHGRLFGDGDRHEKVVNMLDRRLDLSDDQETRIAAIVEETMDRMHEIRRQRQDSIAELVRSDSIDKRQVADLMDFQEITDEAKEAMAEGIVAMHAVLTPEQRAEAGDLIVGWDGHGRRFRGWGFHHDDDHDDDDRRRGRRGYRDRDDS